MKFKEITVFLEWVYQKYVVDGLSAKKIGGLCGRSSGSIRRFLERQNIRVRTSPRESLRRFHREKRGETVLDHPEELRKLYIGEGLPPHVIAAMIGTSTSGPRSNFWEGGISKHHRAPGFSRGLKKKIRDRDRNRCVICETTRDLVVHHRNSDGDDHRESNLVTLCRSCHSWVHVNHCTVTILAEDLGVNHRRCIVAISGQK
jgi:hypothetical protein